MAIRTGNAAVTWAWNHRTYPKGMCLAYVRQCFGVGSKYASASIAWRLAKFRHTRGNPPIGVPVFWTGGSEGHGHIALYIGNGYCLSTDVPRGKVNKIKVSSVASYFGSGLRYVGWTEDVNGVRVWSQPRGRSGGSGRSGGTGRGGSRKPTVDLSQLITAARHDPRRRGNAYTTGAADDVNVVQAALVKAKLLSTFNASNNRFNAATVSAYARWQRQCGYRGKDANGIPGIASLRKLGARYGFNVVL